MNRGMIRDTRLLDKSDWDDPFRYCEAGSTEEADMLAEWDRWDLVHKIMELDKKLWELENDRR